MFVSLIFAATTALQTPSTDVPQNLLAPKPKAGTVMALVNGRAITMEEVERYLWDWRAYEVLQDLITYRMLSAESAKIGFKLDEDAVANGLQVQLKQVQDSLPEGKKLDQALLEQGFPKSRLYLRVKTQMMLDAAVLASFKPEDFVDVATIIVRPRSEQASDLADAIQQAQTAYDELEKGAKWDDVLRRFHTDAQILQTHGRIGWRALRAFPESVAREIRTLGRGGITRPAQTANGIQIFRIEQLGEDAKGEELNQLRQQFLAGGRQQVLERIRKEVKVENLSYKF